MVQRYVRMTKCNRQALGEALTLKLVCCDRTASNELRHTFILERNKYIFLLHTFITSTLVVSKNVFLMCGMNHHLSDISLVVWEVNTDGKTEVLVTVVSITWRQNLWEGIPTTWVVKYSPLCLIAMDEPGQDQWAESAINKKEGGENRRECKDKSVVRSATPRKETKWRSCDHFSQF